MEDKGDMAKMICNNPDCDNLVHITRKQKRDFMTTYPKRYGRFMRPYCSEECQQAHSAELKK